MESYKPIGPLWSKRRERRKHINFYEHRIQHQEFLGESHEASVKQLT